MFTIVFAAAGLLGPAGCGENSEPGGNHGNPGSGQAENHLVKLELAQPTPEQLGDGWVYATGRRGGVIAKRVFNQVYRNEELGISSIRVKADLRPSVAAAKTFFEHATSGVKTPPLEGLGQEARIENRRSRTRYVLVCFRRANVVITIHNRGENRQIALDVARIVDKMIENNLESVQVPTEES